ncbi:MAG TPA: hypothetical protein VL944_00840 [Candidatus Acidoferrum sp.]|nr:hypothetical protein [Candidatus Acidoferrum sp.]
MSRPRLSRSNNGKVKIVQEGTTVIFEVVKQGVMQSSFDSTGGITDQVLLKGSDAEKYANDFISKASKEEPILEDYSAIVLQKDCPKCGTAPLTRYMDTMAQVSEAPVMPFYVCTKCKTKCYHLTDEYLKNLVTSNRQLFEDSQIAEFGSDEKKFMAELRAYIIRIFASQRIMHTK